MPLPTLRCSVLPPGAGTAPGRPPRHQQHQHHQQPSRCPAHTQRSHKVTRNIQLHAPGTRHDVAASARPRRCLLLLLLQITKHTEDSSQDTVPLLATCQQFSAGCARGLTVGIACVLTQMPAPSGKLGSAQRRTASSSDNGSTSGSSSAAAEAAAAALAALPPAAAAGAAPARCWLDNTPAIRFQHNT